MSAAEYTPFVSIIVPTFNEAMHIRQCLGTLLNQDYPRDRFEVIVVDNGSTDDTVSIAQTFVKDVHTASGLSVAAVRNFGAARAQGEVLAFIDGDCEAARDWLRSAVSSLGIEPAVTGSKCRIPDNAQWIERVWFVGGGAGRREVNYINTGNLILSTTLFKTLNGFDATLVTGEDSEFCTRAKKSAKIIEDSSIKVVHLGNPKTLGAFFRREIWHGLGALGSFKQEWRDKPFLGTLLFLALTLIQIAGLGRAVLFGHWNLFVGATFGLVLLIVAAVIYRGNQKTPVDYLRLGVLYYLFFLGRTLSLFILATKGRYYHHNKNSADN